MVIWLITLKCPKHQSRRRSKRQIILSIHSYSHARTSLCLCPSFTLEFISLPTFRHARWPGRAWPLTPGVHQHSDAPSHKSYCSCSCYCHSTSRQRPPTTHANTYRQTWFKRMNAGGWKYLILLRPTDRQPWELELQETLITLPPKIVEHCCMTIIAEEYRSFIPWVSFFKCYDDWELL